MDGLNNFSGLWDFEAVCGCLVAGSRMMRQVDRGPKCDSLIREEGCGAGSRLVDLYLESVLMGELFTIYKIGKASEYRKQETRLIQDC